MVPGGKECVALVVGDYVEVSVVTESYRYVALEVCRSVEVSVT